MSFDGKTTAEITEVLKMFGGDWKEEKQKIKMINYKCLTCNNMFKISENDDKKLTNLFHDINEKLRGIIGTNIDILNILDIYMDCCVDASYIEDSITLE